VGFVNSGLLNLTQAIGVIMGANVGTTFSAQLIAFKIDTVAPLFIFIGIVMYLFFKKKSIKNVGYVILGFGILFFSISVMGSPLKELAKQPAFNAMLTTFENPFYALIAGFIFTAIIQSSSATMGLLVTMNLSGVPIPFETSAYIILGTNIGTSLTTVIASIPANRDSKRAALFHIMYDIIGCTVFGTLIFFIPAILGWFEITWAEKARQVAMFHTLYNVAVCIMLLPFVKYVAILMQKLVPVKQKEKDKTHEKKLIYLDVDISKMPAIAAVNAAHSEICRMGKIASENLALALESFFEKNEEKAEKIFKIEKIINFISHQIAGKLVEINNMRLTKSDAERVGKMFKIISDVERIGDHAENIAEYTLLIKDNNLKISDAAIDELKRLSDLTTEQTIRCMAAYEQKNKSELFQIRSFEKEIDQLSENFIENHIQRLKEEKCEPQSGVIFTDMIINLERCADHAENIAVSL
jgi:phosphate:Na+ symporter